MEPEQGPWLFGQPFRPSQAADVAAVVEYADARKSELACIAQQCWKEERCSAERREKEYEKKLKRKLAAAERRRNGRRSFEPGGGTFEDHECSE